MKSGCEAWSPSPSSAAPLLAVAGFPCASDRKHKHQLLRFEPPVEGNVGVPAAGDDELPTPLFDPPADQGMPFKDLKCVLDSRNRRYGATCISPRMKLEDPLQVVVCLPCQLERRHALARGRLVFLPAARAFK